MKYRMTYDSLERACSAFCSHCCGHCAIGVNILSYGDNMTCSQFIHNYPDKAAELMRLDVVGDKDKSELTEHELSICKTLGAKWITLNGKDRFEDKDVYLWNRQPKCQTINGIKFYFEIEDGDCFAAIHSDHFPSLSPGDCVKIAE